MQETPFDETADFVVERAFSGSKGFRPQLRSINGSEFSNYCLVGPFGRMKFWWWL